MTRFTDDLSGRLERDLTQISDQASPSSTAWDAIQQRIDEQDSQPHSDKTMEVIMLDPDTNKLHKRPRTGLLVAASVAAIALIGGLIVVANRDDAAPPADEPVPTVTVPVTDPAIGGDPEPADDAEPAVDSVPVDDAEPVVDSAPVVVDPELPPSTDAAATEGEVLPAVEPVEPAEPPTQGTFEPTCSTGDATEDPANSRLVVEQTCEIAGVDAQPFAADQVIELSLLEGVGTPDSAAGAFLGLGDNEFMQAGLLWNEGTRGSWVGVAEGEGDYAGEPVWLSGDSKQNADGTLDTTEEFDGRWWTTDGPRPSTSDDASTTDDAVLTAEVTATCENVQVEGEFIPFDQTCTYESDDPRFVPETESGRFVLTPADFATTANGSGAVFNDYFTATLGDTTIRAGLVEGGQFVRWVGMRVGTGEFEGLLIQERAWAEIVQGETPGESTGIGVIQMTVLPAEG